MARLAPRPEDVVIALLANVRRRGGHRFQADPVAVHPAFYAWRDQCEFRRLFGAFVFDTRDYFPFSDTLDSVFDSLQFAGYLERTNPRGTWYQITDSVEKVFEGEVRAKFSREQLKSIATLAERFRESIKIDGAREAQPVG